MALWKLPFYTQGGEAVTGDESRKVARNKVMDTLYTMLGHFNFLQ